MVAELNRLSTYWFDYVVLGSIQNSIYLVMILLLLNVFQSANARLLRAISFIALIKMLIPPFISFSVIYQWTPLQVNVFRLDAIFIEKHMDYDVHLSIYTIMMLLWSSIVIVILVLTIINTYRLKQKFRHTRVLDTQKYATIGLDSKIKLLLSNLDHPAVVFGFFKKSIVVPANWENWPEESKRSVLLHEINHIREKDNWLNLLKRIVLALNFFNPLIWILNKRISHYSEMICDEYTVQQLKSDHLTYSKILLKISESLTRVNREMSLSLAFSESHRLMKIRIQYILSRKEKSFMKRLDYKYSLLIAILILAMVPFLWQCSSGTSDQEKVNQPLASERTSDDMLISDQDNDVVIISQLEDQPEIEILHKQMPEYPAEARKNGVSGMVLLIVTVNKSGLIEEAKILKSIPLLDQAALKAVKQFKFKPLKIDDSIVRFAVEIPFEFKLK